MKPTLIFVLVAFLFTITEAYILSVNDSSLNSSLSPIQLNPSKLSFKFAVVWPLGFCQINRCRQGPADLPKRFTIHGLWPNYNGQCTDSTLPFDFTKLNAIYSDLKTYWPNIKSNLKPDEFWKEEWNKHGIKCDIFQTVDTYFKVALQLYKKLDPGLKLLTKEPLKTTPEKIRSLKEFAGRKPFVWCKEVNGVYYLEELRFCMNGKKKFIDCRPQAAQDQYCNNQFKYSATWKPFLGLVDEDNWESVSA